MRASNKLGLWLLLLGAALLLGYAFYESIGEFILTEEIPVVIKVGTVLAGLGVVTVFLSLVFERLNDKEHEHNSYDN